MHENCRFVNDVNVLTTIQRKTSIFSMSRMSARFVGQKVGMAAQWVYDMWKDMGLVEKDRFGDWILTAAGREVGGRMSKGSRLEVPTFEFEVIEKMMIDFYNRRRK